MFKFFMISSVLFVYVRIMLINRFESNLDWLKRLQNAVFAALIKIEIYE